MFLCFCVFVVRTWIDLFIWAVLANRRQMALLMWEKSGENIALALTATKLLKGLVEKELSSKELADVAEDMLEHAT